MAEGKAVGYRGMEKKRQMRKEMEEFARSQDLDPLLADTWYKLSKNPYLMRVCYLSSFILHIQILIS